jgi:hypothetical protein
MMIANLFILSVLLLLPQADGPKRAEFEVASVKPSEPLRGGFIGCRVYPGGRVDA